MSCVGHRQGSPPQEGGPGPPSPPQGRGAEGPGFGALGLRGDVPRVMWVLKARGLTLGTRRAARRP